MPDRPTVAGAVGCALLVAVCLRLVGWPAWATLTAWLVLSAVFVATELRAPGQVPAEPEWPAEDANIGDEAGEGVPR